MIERQACCAAMAAQKNHHCEAHSAPMECVDVLVVYNPRFDEYGIPIRDGGTSVNCIQFCPWCGARLPESKRELWFERLRELGCDDPATQRIPERFTTDAWWREEAQHERSG